MTRPLFGQAATRGLVVAHRGASAREPENTLAAFAAAARAGADLVELDARLTADGVPVVLHDPDLSRTTDRAGLVNRLPLAEVKRADASGGRGPRQEVPTLAEVLALLDGGPTGVDIEVKNLPGEDAFDPEERLLAEVLGVLEGTGFGGRVLITSFHPATVRRSRELAPEVPAGLLAVPAFDPRSALAHVVADGLACVLPQAEALLAAGSPFVEEAHQANVAVGTWTVDDEETMGVLFDWGVDAVATNRPEVAVAVRDRAAGS